MFNKVRGPGFFDGIGGNGPISLNALLTSDLVDPRPSSTGFGDSEAARSIIPLYKRLMGMIVCNGPA
jgi:hypothetical protein